MKAFGIALAAGPGFAQESIPWLAENISREGLSGTLAEAAATDAGAQAR